MPKQFKRVLMTEKKTYGSLDPDVSKGIMKLFKLQSGYVYAYRTSESREWKVVHYWDRDRRKTLGTLREILSLL